MTANSATHSGDRSSARAKLKLVAAVMVPAWTRAVAVLVGLVHLVGLGDESGCAIIPGFYIVLGPPAGPRARAPHRNRRRRRRGRRHSSLRGLVNAPCRSRGSHPDPHEPSPYPDHREPLRAGGKPASDPCAVQPHRWRGARWRAADRTSLHVRRARRRPDANRSGRPAPAARQTVRARKGENPPGRTLVPLERRRRGSPLPLDENAVVTSTTGADAGVPMRERGGVDMAFRIPAKQRYRVRLGSRSPTRNRSDLAVPKSRSTAPFVSRGVARAGSRRSQCEHRERRGAAVCTTFAQRCR
jgi:hypothetical protein